MLDYEKLDVYRCAIAHLAFVFRSIPAIPRGYSALRLLGVISDSELAEAKLLLVRLVGMVSKMCR